jgi:hypothetical protein
VLGPDHIITLTAAGTLVMALLLVGQVKPARTLGDETLQRCHLVLGPDHPVTL